MFPENLEVFYGHVIPLLHMICTLLCYTSRHYHHQGPRFMSQAMEFLHVGGILWNSVTDQWLNKATLKKTNNQHIFTYLLKAVHAFDPQRFPFWSKTLADFHLILNVAAAVDGWHWHGYRHKSASARVHRCILLRGGEPFAKAVVLPGCWAILVWNMGWSELKNWN